MGQKGPKTNWKIKRMKKYLLRYQLREKSKQKSRGLHLWCRQTRQA
jgi:hypothetical protein